MAEKRSRDKVWSVAMALTYKSGKKITPDEIADYTNVSERTVRDVLNIMADEQLLKRDKRSDGSVVYQTSPYLYWENDSISASG